VAKVTDDKQYAFFEGKFVDIDDAKVSIKTHVIQYGTGVFEGIRGYWNAKEEEIYLFRMREHFERMIDSMKIMRIECKYSVDELCDMVVELVKKNKPNTDIYIRPLAYKNSTAIGPGLHNNPSEFCCYTVPFGAYFKGGDDGLKVMVSSWRRLEDNAIPPRAKVTGAYANTAQAKTDAVLYGFDDAIVLTEDGHVSEGSAMNIFLVKNGELITTPVSDNILVGITLTSIIEFCKEELGVTATRRKVDRTELYAADEIFFCGTGAEVVSVVEVDRRPVGNGSTGPMCTKVRDLYHKITHGEVEKYHKWLTPVYAKKGSKIGAR
jgi:branched-chain amino acid aminotransferase